MNSFKSLTSIIPMPAVMDRYIASELLGPFLFGVGAFSSVGVAVGILFDLVRKIVETGLPIAIASQVFLLNLPAFIVLAFPMSTLLSALMTYSRLSSDSELIALRSSGVSIYRLVLPAVVLSFVVTGITFFFNEQLVPIANYQATQTLQSALKQNKPILTEQNIFYPEYKEVKQPNGEKTKILSRLFYADKFDGQQMQGLVIVDRSESGINQILVSDSAAWNRLQNIWDFFNGTIYLVAPDSSYRNIVRFEHQQLQLPRTALDLAAKGRDFGEMNIAQATEQLKLLNLSGDEKKIRKLKVRIQEKLSLPFVCIVFGLVGAALGTNPQRAGKAKATSFGISIVVIFSYYLLSFISSALGVSGVVSPIVSAWLPTAFGLMTGGLLLVRAAR